MPHCLVVQHDPENCSTRMRFCLLQAPAAAATPPSHQSFSWSKVACTTTKQQPTSNQPKRQQPPQKKPTATVVESNKAVAAFWEEAAMESDPAYNTKSTGGSKEEVDRPSSYS